MSEFGCEQNKWTLACLSEKEQTECGQLLELKEKLKNQTQKVEEQLALKI